MKLTYTLLMVAFLQTANAQDFCKSIRKEAFEDKITFECTSPYNVNDKPAVRVTRSYNIDPEFGYDNFYINFRLEGNIDSIYTKSADGEKIERADKKLTVEFDDNSKIVDDTVSINHDVSDDHTLAVWYLDYSLSDDQLKAFASKKIVKFSLAGNNQVLQADSANSVLHYVQCIKDIKKEKKKSQ